MVLTASMDHLQLLQNSGLTVSGQLKKLVPERSLVDKCGKHLFKNLSEELQDHLINCWSFQMDLKLRNLPNKLLLCWEKMELLEVPMDILAQDVHSHLRRLQTR